MIDAVKHLPIIRWLREVPWIMRPYHFLLAFVAAWWYGFPSKKMTVIGVTGTKGKTTTGNLIWHIFTCAGRKTGLATTVNFAVGEKEWTNETKQTMLGRFQLQKLLKEMLDAGCRYAVIETSSEGILQYRHRFIDYDTAVFANISPEHIERHGSFEAYREAKVKLFWQVAKKKGGFGVYNLDDPNADHFLEPPIQTKFGFALAPKDRQTSEKNAKRVHNYFEIGNVELKINKSKFTLGKDSYETPLIGAFNVQNAVLAACTALAHDVPIQKIRAGLATARPVAGRFEVVNLGQPFTIVIDYAHEPTSLAAIYEAVKLFKPKNIIGLLGAQGGGRDRWKRGAMGAIAAKYCGQIVLTNEDPYDEDPLAIIADIKKGIYDVSKNFIPVYKIPDRREAILRALRLARKGDAVVLTGKGGEVWMCLERGRKIYWNEREVVEKLVAEHENEFLTRSGRNMRYEDE
jgi:UDP-N-acetylmuramoyl-L-alanyl-D-glutamate--2,6-diaminopimelate ligase